MYLVRRQGFGRPEVRAYAAWNRVPRKWRTRYLGPLPAPTRRLAEMFALVLGWGGNHGKLPDLTGMFA